MKIKIKQEIETEIDVTFPLFYKNSAFFYKVMSETMYIELEITSTVAIRISKNSRTFVEYILTNSSNVKCTEQEFIEAYMTAKDMIDDMLPVC